MTAQPKFCPCQSGREYDACCQPRHTGKTPAETPEALMRSRYCAFTLALWPYLIATHHKAHLNGLTETMLAEGPQTQWLGLDVIASDSVKDSGSVTFKAWYKDGQGVDAIFEQSQFIREDGLWFYTTGEQFTAQLPGRNDVCICKSGKKFKKCCGK